MNPNSNFQPVEKDVAVVSKIAKLLLEHDCYISRIILLCPRGVIEDDYCYRILVVLNYECSTREKIEELENVILNEDLSECIIFSVRTPNEYQSDALLRTETDLGYMIYNADS